ncbi:MAG: patatin-like phospholipase family protein, partial [Vicinamibacteria bacterium]
EMLLALGGDSSKFSQLRPVDFYHINVSEYVRRPLRFAYELATFVPGLGYDLLLSIPQFPREASASIRRFLRKRSYSNFEDMLQELYVLLSPRREVPSLAAAFPAGIFDNSALERYIRENLERNGMPNDFSTLYGERKKEVYITATNLDTAERVIFGTFERTDATISEAIQASTALPGFYRPARIGGIDYVDGGVRSTANIDVAIDHGADLIICYNPFRPFVNRVEIEEDSSNGRTSYRVTRGRRLADRGARTVLNQVLRTMLHSRLEYGLRRYAEDERFQGDIILIEPQETDYRFFDLNPLAFWARAESARHGYLSVRQSIENCYDEISAVLGAYGLEMALPDEQPGVENFSRARSARGAKAAESHEKTAASHEGERKRSLRLIR